MVKTRSTRFDSKTQLSVPPALKYHTRGNISKRDGVLTSIKGTIPFDLLKVMAWCFSPNTCCPAPAPAKGGTVCTWRGIGVAKHTTNLRKSSVSMCT